MLLLGVSGGHSGPPTDQVWQLGFGSGFFKDSSKTVPATADGDLVYTAADGAGASDLVQATAANRPILDLKTFTKPALLYQSWRGCWSATAGSLPSLNPQGFTFTAILKYHSLAFTSGTPVAFVLGSTFGASYGWFFPQTSLPLPKWSTIRAGTGQDVMPTAMAPGATVLTLVSSAGAFKVRVNGVEVGSYAAFTGASLPQIQFGRRVTQEFGHFSLAGAKAFNRVLSAGELTALDAASSAYATSGSVLGSTGNAFVVVGDSLSSGTNISNDQATWPVAGLNGLTNAATYLRQFANLAIPGSTLASDWMSAGNQALLDSYYDAGRAKNVLFVFLGTNDSTDGPTTYANLTTYCAARKAVGWTVVVFDMLPRGNTGLPNTRRDSLNASLAADFTTAYAPRVKTGGAAYAAALVQVGADPTIGGDTAPTNATYYSAVDFTHLTDAGDAIFGGYVTTAMHALGFT